MNLRAVVALLAINLALPLALAKTLPLFPGMARTVAVLIFVIVIFTMNQQLRIFTTLSRRIIWPLQALNLASAVLLGNIAFATSLPSWWALFQWVWARS